MRDDLKKSSCDVVISHSMKESSMKSLELKATIEAENKVKNFINPFSSDCVSEKKVKQPFEFVQKAPVEQN